VLEEEVEELVDDEVDDELVELEDVDDDELLDEDEELEDELDDEDDVELLEVEELVELEDAEELVELLDVEDDVEELVDEDEVEELVDDELVELEVEEEDVDELEELLDDEKSLEKTKTDPLRGRWNSAQAAGSASKRTSPSDSARLMNTASAKAPLNVSVDLTIPIVVWLTELSAVTPWVFSFSSSPSMKHCRRLSEWKTPQTWVHFPASTVRTDVAKRWSPEFVHCPAISLWSPRT